MKLWTYLRTRWRDALHIIILVAIIFQLILLTLQAVHALHAPRAPQPVYVEVNPPAVYIYPGPLERAYPLPTVEAR